MATLRGGTLTGGIGGGGGSGTVTSVAPSVNGGLASTPNPITTVGTVRLNFANLLTLGVPLAPTDLVAISSGGIHYSTTVASFSGTYLLDFTNGDLVLGVLSVTHSLNQRPVVVQVYDSAWVELKPDSIELTGVNSCLINLSSFQPLVGTFHLIVKR